jgi:lipopolysaccharide transport system ATP-binding protein
MGNSVIQIENLHKEYRLGVIGHGTLYHDLQSWWSRVRNKEDPNAPIGHQTFANGKDRIWALNGIDLEVKEGEVLGIIGRNGAGKSTLLKILSRVTAPSRGIVRLKGRIASLLEVGTGFHGELTGRENIYLNGLLNGMSGKDVTKKLDEIVDFAGVEKFLDTPVKRYSSGMYVRLGFAVGAHLEPDILVVDEVLAVGDYEFQSKCIGKMKDVSERGGRTVLFVSHNLNSVRELCTKAVLLEQGKVVREGGTEEIISYYTESAIEKRGERVLYQGSGATSDGNGVLLEMGMRLNAIRSLNGAGEVCDMFTVRDEVYVQVEYDMFIDFQHINVELFLKNQRGEFVLFAYDDQCKPSLEQRKRKAGRYISTCKIPGDLLNDGSYTMVVKAGDRQRFYFEEEGCSFDVTESNDPEGAMGLWNTGRWPPVAVRPQLQWDIEYLSF